MNSQPNSLTSTKPSSPIPTEPNSPTTTPPRSTTPSDLFWQIQMIQKRRMIGLIFDDLILLNHWSTLLKKTLVLHIEDMITIKEVLIVLIRDIKYYLPMSVAPPAEQLALVTELQLQTIKPHLFNSERTACGNCLILQDHVGTVKRS